eukprot:TRINITY_DN159_c0_g1_i4.p1 TRINITY_DN159_c0_g1~~TRINITY_DN159_c0_g1_i4.p1  ORF type:complete len:330 (+),score=77.42 TRINITY_DN159_c0_g1_i4:245-1234(+)
MRSLESWNKQPYCRTHVPKAKATEVSDGFHDRQVKEKPRAAVRQKGVAVDDGRTFSSGNLARGGADTGASGDALRVADSGTWESSVQGSTADTGTHTGGAVRQSDQGTFESQAQASQCQAGKDWGQQTGDSGTYESTAGHSTADTGTFTGGAVRQSDQGTFESNPQSYQEQGYEYNDQGGNGGYSAPAPSGGYSAPARTPAPAPAAGGYDAPAAGGYDDTAGGYDESGGYDEGADGGYDESYDDTAAEEYDNTESYDDSAPAITSAPPAAGGAGTCTALYDYAGENEGDLAFSAGDVITVLDDSDPSGWWQGDLNGAVGYFPSNFVEKT